MLNELTVDSKPLVELLRGWELNRQSHIATAMRIRQMIGRMRIITKARIASTRRTITTLSIKFKGRQKCNDPLHNSLDFGIRGTFMYIGQEDIRCCSMRQVLLKFGVSIIFHDRVQANLQVLCKFHILSIDVKYTASTPVQTRHVTIRRVESRQNPRCYTNYKELNQVPSG